jgi:predicted HTH transcriptional regulator
MNYKDLKELILFGESSTVEFKRKISSLDKIAKEIAAFANTKGGYLIIGVDDDKTIIGVPSEKEVIEQLDIACNFKLSPAVEPQIEIVNIYHKDVIVAYIPESERKPHRLVIEEKERKSQQPVYIRIGDTSLTASREMAHLLAEQNPDSDPLHIVFGDREKRLFAYLEDNTKITVKEFSKLVNISFRRSERLLIGLVRAGVLQIHVDSSSDYFTAV